MVEHGVPDFFTAGHCYLYGGEQDFQGIGGAILHTAMLKSSGALVRRSSLRAAWWEIITDLAASEKLSISISMLALSEASKITSSPVLAYITGTS